MDGVNNDTAWGDWFRDMGASVLDTVAQIEVAKTQQLGQNGYFVEGKRVTTPVNVAAQQAGISTNTLLLIGAALVAVILLKG